MELQALNHSVSPVVPQPSTISGKYTKEDIQEMLGRHTLDNEVIFLLFYFVFFYKFICFNEIEYLAVLYFKFN